MERLTERNPSWIDDEMWEMACEPDCEEIDAVYRKLKAYEDAEEQGQYGKWIPVSERLPEEHDSIFKKFKGTSKWDPAMFEKTSGYVIATVEYMDGTRLTTRAHTTDGIWKADNSLMTGKVVAWMPPPEPYRESEVEDGEVL